MRGLSAFVVALAAFTPQLNAFHFINSRINSAVGMERRITLSAEDGEGGNQAPRRKGRKELADPNGLAPRGFHLFLDCDGVIAETERDGHRVAFNQAFKEKGFDTVWDEEMYGELLKIGGGKERMTHHWNEVGWPTGYEAEDSQNSLVKELHLRKTEIFNQMIKGGTIPLRSGILRLVDGCIETGTPIAVCSTSSVDAVTNIVETLMGQERKKHIRIFAGDMVEKKKPAPDVYLLAANSMNAEPERCWVIEDSAIGLQAAKAAGMMCMITKSYYTKDEDFRAAHVVLDTLGEDRGVDLLGIRAMASEHIIDYA